ncbi:MULTISPECIES: Nif3-like dinuclear metal center hexameric protein [Trichocoleus]|uniref:Nif3-like dinuclear metal center hexameric protein n=1 Tax=Trichocoleus TaxID=450526 RepID=UPI00168873B9|nr:Nif3-like dinuclear metal center hexameric protein [Trichocoleus sp. FACHB-46]MBD1863127.1 Nif3-like dinuclear metal center hexameric protein [Trichocoleus sp. FACHB-46]
MIYLAQLAEFLNQFLRVHQFELDPGGIYRPSNLPIQRLGLALEPWSDLAEWVTETEIDALFLHRPWKLEGDQLPAHVGVVAYHLAFDEQMTIGFNPLLANTLGLFDLEVLGQKAGRPIGMLGSTSSQCLESFCDRVQQAFGGCEAVERGLPQTVTKVAVVGAMTEDLVRDAKTRGAEIYITGQFRQPARSAVLETGINVIVVGHRRSEEWGLQALAGVLRERWLELQVILPPS